MHSFLLLLALPMLHSSATSSPPCLSIPPTKLPRYFFLTCHKNRFCFVQNMGRLFSAKRRLCIRFSYFVWQGTRIRVCFTKTVMNNTALLCWRIEQKKHSLGRVGDALTEKRLLLKALSCVCGGVVPKPRKLVPPDPWVVLWPRSVPKPSELLLKSQRTNPSLHDARQ